MAKTITLEELKSQAYWAFNTAAGGDVLEVTREGQAIARLSETSPSDHVGITPVPESDFYDRASAVVGWVVEKNEPIWVSSGLRDKSILIEPVVR